jgi:hypothetical protein
LVDAAPVESPVPLRPLAPTELIDQAFAVLKSAPGTLLALAALFVVPVQLASAWLQRGAVPSGGFLEVLRDPNTLETFEQQGESSNWGAVVSWLGPSLTLPFVAAGVALFMAARHAGRDPSLGELLRGALRRSPALVVAWVLVHLAEAGGALACGFPALLVMALFLVTAPAIAVEGLGPLRGMGRAASLARRRYWPTLAVGVLSGVVAQLFEMALSSAWALLAVLFGTAGAGWMLIAVSGVMSSIVTMPVIAAATTLHYLDLRVRSEGLDLEVDLTDAFPAAAARG